MIHMTRKSEWAGWSVFVCVSLFVSSKLDTFSVLFILNLLISNVFILVVVCKYSICLWVRYFPLLMQLV